MRPDAGYIILYASVGSQAGVGHLAERPGPASGFGPKPKVDVCRGEPSSSCGADPGTEAGLCTRCGESITETHSIPTVVLMRRGVLLKVLHPSPHEAFYYVLTHS